MLHQLRELILTGDRSSPALVDRVRELDGQWSPSFGAASAIAITAAPPSAATTVATGFIAGLQGFGRPGGASTIDAMPQARGMGCL
jgi:hypothetical protein